MMSPKRSLANNLLKHLDARKKVVDKQLTKLLRATPARRRYATLDKSLKHTVFLKGKRLRPILAIMAYELYDKDIKKILEPACAIELIHAGSLMLDDLPSMDDAHFRRGKATNHDKFGNAVTILATAGLWSEAISLIDKADDGKSQLVRRTAECIGTDGLILGQYMDLYAFDKKQSLKTLRKCYELKTGTLFKLAMSFGGVLGGANEKQLALLEDFGTSFGIAYQIRDDIIDATATKNDSGKDTKKDELNNKPNYVSLLGIEKTQKAFKDELARARKILKQITHDTQHFEKLLQAISL